MSSPAVPAAAAETAADRAYRHMKRLILNGDLPGGQLLSENEVAVQLGISRTPVHEAFLRLDAENLLALSSRRGATVVPMGPEEARDVLELREAIETSTARRAMANGRPAARVLKLMRDNVNRQRRLAAAGDIDAFVEADADFHAALVRASRNQVALQFHDLLRDRQYRLQAHHLHIGPQTMPAALGDHETMLAAAENGDAEAFCRLVATHVRRHRSDL